MTTARKRVTKSRRLALLAFLLLALQLGAQGLASWELAVCADPNRHPWSGRQEPGYENMIAEIIADELNAKLTYVWAQSNEQMVREHLWTGDCDVIFGVSEGTAGVLNTIAYHRSPYVFVQRSDTATPVSSLDQEILRDLKIATYPSGPPHRALIEYGLQENIIFYPPARQNGRIDRDTPTLAGVIEGEVDLAILYGPAAGYFAKHGSDDLIVRSVSPEIVPPHFQMFTTLTAVVRPGDDSLRHLLNAAFAQRWEEIRKVLHDYGIPELSLPRPQPPRTAENERLRLGVILPLPTEQARDTDTLATAARHGVHLAERLVPAERTVDKADLRILVSSAPTARSISRAARRMIATSHPTALVGGLDLEQAKALRQVAEDEGVLFFNIAVTDDEFREDSCGDMTFHVEASASMYLDAAVAWYAANGDLGWFVVYEESPTGFALFESAVHAIENSQDGAVLIGTASIPTGLTYEQSVLDSIEKASPDIVLLLLPPEGQEFFLSQYQLHGLEHPVTGFPHPQMQTRDALGSLGRIAGGASAARIALWDTALEEAGADELNGAFVARTAEPMDPIAWATYASLAILTEASDHLSTLEPSRIVAYLEGDEASFDLGKGIQLSFRAWNHQLRQPLYAVEPAPEEEWGRSVSQRIAQARLLGRIPEESRDAGARELLDRLGEAGSQPACD